MDFCEKINDLLHCSGNQPSFLQLLDVNFGGELESAIRSLLLGGGGGHADRVVMMNISMYCRSGLSKC